MSDDPTNEDKFSAELDTIVRNAKEGLEKIARLRERGDVDPKQLDAYEQGLRKTLEGLGHLNDAVDKAEQLSRAAADVVNRDVN